MDYEFRRNTFDDSFYCEFSMGHEAVGRWLLDEIGTDRQELTDVIGNIEQAIENGKEWHRLGHSFQLWLSQDEALIKANFLHEEDEQALLDEGLHSNYDQESIALCGPEDLLAALHAWQDFLAQFGRR